jgi:hypothetical protein
MWNRLIVVGSMSVEPVRLAAVLGESSFGNGVPALAAAL